MKTFSQIFNRIKKEDLQYYGLKKSVGEDKEIIIELICLLPKLAFDIIKNEEPRLLLMTSGTLPEKERAEKLYDLKFNSSESFSLENSHKLYFSTIKSPTINYELL